MEENQMAGFNIFEQQKPTNQDMNIIFTPNSSIRKYEYRIIKNGELGEYIEISNNQPINIFFNKSGNYKVEVKMLDYYNNVNYVSSGVYNIDKDKPIIELNQTFIKMEKGSIIDIMGGIKAYDKQDGDLLNKVTSNYDDLDFSTLGTKKLVYSVVDNAGNVTNSTVNIDVIPNYSQGLLIMQLSILIFLFVLIWIIYKFRHSMVLEKRLSKYSIKSIKDNYLSIFDNLLILYKKIINYFNKILLKSTFMIRYSHHYDKYINKINHIYTSGMGFISSKLICSFIFLFIAILSMAIQYQVLSTYQLLLPVIIGFFAPDIVYMYQYRLYHRKIENDLLQAIIVMNNAFKSGRSIIQAIELVTHQLDGPIAEEFKKMHLEITFGLSIDIVFQRFSDRINLEEVSYLTASLTILNQTGGDIIKVFSSIEKNLFNKKKLKLELKSLTGSSKIIVYVLGILPIFFILLINLISPNYFIPFYNTSIGIILSVIMLIIYIFYLIFVRKIMKVRM